MSDRVLVPLSDGRWLALTPEQLNEALTAGAAVMAPQRPEQSTAPSGLLKAEEMEQRTGVKASWWLTQAREKRIPFTKLGRYVRFDIDALTRANLVPSRGNNSQ